jgi:stage V sporulation protein SpoVS
LRSRDALAFPYQAPTKTMHKKAKAPMQAMAAGTVNQAGVIILAS